jgi:hypothetical protein
MEQKKIMARLEGEMEKVAKSWSVFFHVSFFLCLRGSRVCYQKKNERWNQMNTFSFFSCGCSHFFFDSSRISIYVVSFCWQMKNLKMDFIDRRYELKWVVLREKKGKKNSFIEKNVLHQ